MQHEILQAHLPDSQFQFLESVSLQELQGATLEHKWGDLVTIQWSAVKLPGQDPD